MRKFFHTIVFKISNFKVSDYVEIGFAPNETKWQFKNTNKIRSLLDNIYVTNKKYNYVQRN